MFPYFDRFPEGCLSILVSCCLSIPHNTWYDPHPRPLHTAQPPARGLATPRAQTTTISLPTLPLSASVAAVLPVTGIFIPHYQMVRRNPYSLRQVKNKTSPLKLTVMMIRIVLKAPHVHKIIELMTI